MGRRRSILVTVVLAVTTVGFAAVPATFAAGGTISGVVRDSAGVPIVGATVRATGEPFGFVRSDAVLTDATGSYVLAGLAPSAQPWKVLAGATGFAPTYSSSTDFQSSEGFLVTVDESYTVDVTLARPTASIAA